MRAPMPLIAIPNVSEGRDEAFIDECRDAVRSSRARVLDVHSDPVHNRSVLTVTGASDALVDAMAALAVVAARIDVSAHIGVHPRLGGLDVCPVVPHGDDMASAIATARAIATSIAADAGTPVYLYGAAATREETRSLPELRRSGLPALIARARTGLAPDAGPAEIDPHRGVVCVGARPELVAFNVWIAADEHDARAIAADVRRPDAVRALGFPMDAGTSQVSMNLVDPGAVNIDDAYELVARACTRRGVRLLSTEIVGLPPERFMPDPQKEAARRLIAPGRSLESVLRA